MRPSSAASGTAYCFRLLSIGSDDICLSKIRSFEKQRLAPSFRQSVRKAVAKIQTRRMTALAEIEESLPCQVPLLDGNGPNCDIGAAKEDIALPAAVRANLAFQHQGEFDEVSDTNQAAVGA